MTIQLLAALSACAILAGLTIFQVALICGAPIAKYAWGGQHTILPMRLRIGSVVSIGIYIFIAVIILSKVGTLNILETFADVGSWIIAVYFWLGTVLNAISRSKSERAVMTPVALTLALLTTFIALS